MAIDYKQTSAYLERARNIEKALAENRELFDLEKLDEFRQVTTTLEQKIKIAQQQSRKLSIGIVGAVKSGKSSFLNACMFEGKEFLPKAATPMTAALTKITYSETPKAVVHFYTREDWDRVVADAGKYDAGLDSAYQEYCQQQTERAKYQKQGTHSVFQPLMLKEEYELKLYRAKVSEVQKGAKELTQMVTDLNVLNKLGSADTIEGDIMGKLNDYVGAGGTYTPIVSYVELQTNSPYVEDFEIVDTPGLNDPVVSRGIVTKQFLRSCDVVLLLSPCSQFMDAQTITLMANSLPNAGVREVIVIGSKLDSGILNESNQNFLAAYKMSVESYRTQFRNTLAKVQGGGKQRDLVEKIIQASNSPLFVSSTCFAIAQKQKCGEKLDESEELVLKNLKRLAGFDDEKHLLPIGGIKKVKDALEAVKSRKAKIIEESNDAILNDARLGHLRTLDRILQETVSSRAKLETVSAEELHRRIKNIRDIIDTSRERLINLFDGAVIQCDAKVDNLRPNLKLEKQYHQGMMTNTDTHDETEVVHTGFLGLRKEIEHYTVTNHSVDTSCVIDNLQQYAAKCQVYVNGEFQHIFNKEQFSRNIIEVVLAAFQKGEREFDEYDIRIPLQNVLNKISIAHIELDSTRYIDEVETRFKDGYAKNEEIHQLASLQARLLNDIEIDIGKQLSDALTGISKTLNEQAVHFADDIEGKLCGELEKLQGQVDEREKYIASYNRFAEKVRGLMASISKL